jgi:hypothetical protein
MYTFIKDNWIPVVLFAALAIASTLPLITNPAGLTFAPPYGGTDIMFNTWVIHWGAHALVSDPGYLIQSSCFLSFCWQTIQPLHIIC